MAKPASIARTSWLRLLVIAQFRLPQSRQQVYFEPGPAPPATSEKQFSQRLLSSVIRSLLNSGVDSLAERVVIAEPATIIAQHFPSLFHKTLLCTPPPSSPFTSIAKSNPMPSGISSRTRNRILYGRSLRVRLCSQNLPECFTGLRKGVVCTTSLQESLSPILGIIRNAG